MIVVGVGVGFLFALLVLAISVVSFPLLLDRDVGLHTAVRTSIRAVAANPGPDGRLGPDSRGRPGDRVDTRIPWSHHRDASARARHLAPVPQGGGAEHVAISARQCP